MDKVQLCFLCFSDPAELGKCHSHDFGAILTVFFFIRHPFVGKKTVGLSSRATTTKKIAIKSIYFGLPW